MKKKEVASVHQYIAGFPADVQRILKRVRATIRKAAPRAEETISYRIPAYKLNGSPLIYFAAFKSHIGVYPVTRAERAKFKELAKYKGGKGTARFPLDKPIPYGLIGRIVKFRMAKAS